MSNYIRNIRTSVEFDGDTIELMLRPLKRVEFTELQPLFKTQGGEVVVECSMTEFLGTVQPIITDCIQTFSGLFIEGEEVIVTLQDGKPVPKNKELFDEIFEASYFLELIPLIFTELVLGSVMGREKDVEKKSGETHSESSTA